MDVDCRGLATFMVRQDTGDSLIELGQRFTSHV